MYRDEFQRLEGVWIGTETVHEPASQTTARLVFTTVFDGRFLLCDYVLTAADKTTSVGHGVFRRDDASGALTVTWFRSPAATASQQGDAVADGEKLVFSETINGRTTRTTYAVSMDKLAVRGELLQKDGEWKSISDGAYRRR